jgi:hypothetical protein
MRSVSAAMSDEVDHLSQLPADGLHRGPAVVVPDRAGDSSVA